MLWCSPSYKPIQQQFPQNQDCTPPPPPTISVRFCRVRLQRFNKIGALKTAFDLFDRLAHTRRLFMGRIKHTRFQVSLLLAPYRREGENTGNKVENEEKRGKPNYQMNHV